MYTYKKHNLDLKDTTKWPEAEKLKLNERQMQAYKHSLTNRFSIIQGPPGTGKTLIGLELVTTLLKNTDEQILILCNTNHALDQFLTGILNVTDDIVRMGNQSKNELLDQFNIKQLSQNQITDKRIKTFFYKLKCEYADLMQKFEELQNQIDGTDADRNLIEKKMLDIQVRHFYLKREK